MVHAGIMVGGQGRPVAQDPEAPAPCPSGLSLHPRKPFSPGPDAAEVFRRHCADAGEGPTQARAPSWR